MRRLRETDRERGTVSAVVVVLFVFLLILAGLVVDGGNAVNARQRAIDDAEQAARVAANQISEVALRGGSQVVVDAVAADAAARDYLVHRGYASDQIWVVSTGDSVEVTVHDTVETQLLSLALIPTFDIEGVASARTAVGIDQELP